MHPIVEKLIFAAIPIMFTCIVYLLSDLQAIKTRIATVESNAALARSEIVKKTDEQVATTAANTASARAELDKRISILELMLLRTESRGPR